MPSSDERAGLLHHVEFYVADLDTASEFWGWFLPELGYTEYQRWESGQSWKRGPTYLVFVQAPNEHRPFHRRAPGLNHLAFHAESRHHVDGITKKLRQRGISILYGDGHPFAGGEDHYAVYFEAPEPERLKVELVAPSR